MCFTCRRPLRTGILCAMVREPHLLAAIRIHQINVQNFHHATMKTLFSLSSEPSAHIPQMLTLSKPTLTTAERKKTFMFHQNSSVRPISEILILKIEAQTRKRVERRVICFFTCPHTVVNNDVWGETGQCKRRIKPVTYKMPKFWIRESRRNAAIQPNLVDLPRLTSVIKHRISPRGPNRRGCSRTFFVNNLLKSCTISVL